MRDHLFEKIAFLTAPAILAVIIGAHFFLPPALQEQRTFTPAFAKALLNIVFLGLTSLLITYLASKSYLRSGALSILLLGNGALAFGSASMLSEWFLYLGRGSNIMDTVFNSGGLLMGVFQFAATLAVLVQWPRELDPERRKMKLASCYGCVLLAIAVIVAAAYAGWLPVFFAESRGPSLLRQAVTGTSAGLLFVAGLHIMLFFAVNRSRFLYWYALGLVLIAEGFLCAVLQLSEFGLIGWTERIAQYLGGIYMLVAASLLLQERPLGRLLADLLNRPAGLYDSVFQNSMDGILLAFADGALLAANPQALSLLGYGAEETERLHLQQLLRSSGAKAPFFVQNRRSGTRFRGEMPMFRKDGSTFPAEIAFSSFEDEQGKLLKALLFRDISSRKQSQQQLQQAYLENERNLAQLQAIFNQMTDGLVSVDPGGRVAQINRAARRLYGFQGQEEIRLDLDRLYLLLEIADLEGRPLPPQQWPIRRALAGETFDGLEVRGRRRDTGKQWIASYGGAPVYDNRHNLIFALVCVRDITEQKRIQADLRESEERLKGFFKASSVYMSVIELLADDFVFLLANQKAADFFKLPQEGITGKSGRQLGLPAQNVAEAVEILRRCQQSAEPLTLEYLLPFGEGKYCFLATISPIPAREDEAHARFAVSAFDITPRMEAEEKIRQSLEEKESLLQEIHHRVKNNMQVIISLLNLQSTAIRDEKVRLLLKESSSRVNAMALIHNFLYQSASLSEIDLDQYLRGLTASLVAMYRSTGVSIQIDADHVKLNMDQAIPCGLILNELVSNALKHAFPEGRGRVSICARRSGAGRCVLDVRDDGVGLSDEVYSGRSESLGLKLVRGLAENQLGGTLSVVRDHGTRFIIDIAA